MGSKPSYQNINVTTNYEKANTNNIKKYEKIELPEDLETELLPFLNTINDSWALNKDDCPGYTFIFETKDIEFERYNIFISSEKVIAKKIAIYIRMSTGYKGLSGTDYFKINDIDMILKDKRYIKTPDYAPVFASSYAELNGVYNIDHITYKFIDLVKDYHPVLYKLLVWLKNGK